MIKSIINQFVFLMLSGLSWIGGVVMNIVDRTGGPVEISKEEMDKARKQIEECIELSKKKGQG